METTSPLFIMCVPSLLIVEAPNRTFISVPHSCDGFAVCIMSCSLGVSYCGDSKYCPCNSRVTCVTRTCKCKFVLKITCDFIAKASLDYFHFKLLPVSGQCLAPVSGQCMSAYASERIICMWQPPAAIVREPAQDDICTTLRTVKSRIFAWTKGDGLE